MLMTVEQVSEYLDEVDTEFCMRCGDNLQQVLYSRPELVLRRAQVVLLGQIAAQLAVANNTAGVLSVWFGGAERL